MARLSFLWRGGLKFVTSSCTQQPHHLKGPKTPSEQSISTLRFCLTYCEDGDFYSVADTRINKLGGRAWRVKCWDEKSHILSRKSRRSHTRTLALPRSARRLDFACTCEIRIRRAHSQSRNICTLGFAAILTSGRCETPVAGQGCPSPGGG